MTSHAPPIHQVGRQAWQALEMVHAVVYLTPEMSEDLVSLGLEAGRMPYFAGRAAAMGAVGPGVVTATFGNFSPVLVESVIPRAWTLVAPEAVAAARYGSADRVLRRIWGDEVVASPGVARAADLTRRAATACSPIGRPLYAANADLPWPGEPHLALWHAVTLLREHRGDGHVAALAAAGLSGIEAIVTHTATGRGFREDVARTRRGWTGEEWARARADLVDRGLLATGPDLVLTERGQALRAAVEEETDRSAEAPWALLGPEPAQELTTIGTRLTDLILSSEAQIQGFFARGSAFHRPEG